MLANRKLILVSMLGAIIIVIAGTLTTLFVLGQGSNGARTQLQPAAGEVLLKSNTIPFTQPEIGNPLRGVQYYGDENQPASWPFTDTYSRFCWSAIEPSEGQYDFTRIDNAITKAKEAGYTYGWRIMPVNPGNPDCLPNYLKSQMSHGFNYNSQGDVYIPDYNSSAYMSRAQALVNALGQRYDGNPNVGVLDMSLYGCWGEWHESCSDGKGVMSAANRQQLIDMQFSAFPHKRFLMLTDHQDSLDYALKYDRPLRTGVRIDCLGRDNLGGAKKILDSDALARDQWKVAPLYFEYCSQADFSVALNQIKQYHASFVGDGDGNLKDFNSYSSANQDMLGQTFKASGYRFELNALTLPGSLSSGATFSVSTQWTNVNAAPAYQPWNVMIQLRAGDKVSWQSKSQVDLRKPFGDDPQGGEQSIFKDSFQLDTVAVGDYNVCIQIIDPGQVYAPLALANQGRGSDGSYCVGKVKVG